MKALEEQEHISNKSGYIKVIESWETSAFGIIAELQHGMEGLLSGTIVRSTSTGSEWQVKNRVMFYHTSDQQIKFPNELVTHIHVSFNSAEKRTLSSKNILEKEAQNIFQYGLKPLGNNSKPTIDDSLEVFVVEG